MTEEELYRLLRKRFTGNISSGEENRLAQWISESQENQKIAQTLSQVWQEKSSEPELINSEAQIDHIWQQSQGNSKTLHRDWNYLSKIAAVIVLFITTPLLVFNLMQHSLSNSQSQVVIEKIIKSNPVGQKAKFYLPDGSLVWLNGGSTVTYQTGFNETNRNISLKGEAFFEVARNEDLPFRVSSGDLTTTALGTSFNIEAYPEDEYFNVSLMHGKVKVAIENDAGEDIILDPGYQITYYAENKTAEKQSFDPSIVTGWKNGNLVFTSADYKKVVQKLEKWYGVDIATNGNPPSDWRLSTTYQDESLRNILRNLRFGKEFNYKLGKGELTINFK